MRLFGRLAAFAGLLVIATLVIALVTESIRAWHDDRTIRRVGRAVDIGGRRLNLSCIGRGSPTVVFESGHSSPGYVWLPTQRGVARFTRACWYDRAGLGWSDRGPDPNWGNSAARDLQVLLHNAGVAPPYVLVGHSFGGYIIRLFAEAHSGDVAGLVFVDAAQEDAGTIAGIPRRNRRLPRWAINTLATVLPPLGMLRFAIPRPGAQPREWTDEEWRTLDALRRRHAAGLADAHEGPEDATAALVRSAHRFERLPIVVMSQGRIPADPRGAATMEGWQGLQRRFAARAVRSRFVLVTNAGHGIPLEAPDQIVDAVRTLVRDLRRPADPGPTIAAEAAAGRSTDVMDTTAGAAAAHRR